MVQGTLLIQIVKILFVPIFGRRIQKPHLHGNARAIAKNISVIMHTKEREILKHSRSNNVIRLFGFAIIVLVFFYLASLYESGRIGIRLEGRWDFTVRHIRYGETVSSPFRREEDQLQVGPLTFVYSYYHVTGKQ